MATPEIPATPIESLRDALRGDLLVAEVAGLIKESLLEGLKATKDTYVVCKDPECGKKTPFKFPDLGTRVNAVTKLLEEVDGKLRAATEDAQSAIQRKASLDADQLHGMTNQELHVELVGLEEALA